MKAIRRKTTGTGRMRYLRNVPRRFKTGFREGILLIEHFLMCSCLGLFVGFLNYNCVVCLGTQAAPRKQAAAASA